MKMSSWINLVVWSFWMEVVQLSQMFHWAPQKATQSHPKELQDAFFFLWERALELVILSYTENLPQILGRHNLTTSSVLRRLSPSTFTSWPPIQIIPLTLLLPRSPKTISNSHFWLSSHLPSLQHWLTCLFLLKHFPLLASSVPHFPGFITTA